MSVALRIDTKTRGVTLLEVLIALSIGGVVAAGTMSAFVAAVRMSQSRSVTATLAEFAQRPLERNRNRVAVRLPGQSASDAWYDGTGNADPPAGPQGDSAGLPAGTTRSYQVIARDCDGVGGPGDCLEVQVTVQQP